MFSWLSDMQLSIFLFMNIYENIRYQRKIAEKLRGYTYKITYISASNWTTGQSLVQNDAETLPLYFVV